MRKVHAALLLAGLAPPVLAQTPAEPMPGGGGERQESGQPGTTSTPSISSSLGAFGDPGGVRAALEAKGITYGLDYVGEVFTNVRGGLKRGTVYEGKLGLQLDVDFGKLAGLSGLAFHADFFQIHGRGPSRRLIGNLMTASGIEALPSSRLHELWLEQTLFGGTLAVRAGQLAGDSEFIVSQTASLFVNGTFGGPASTSTNLPAGWIAYPWATPAVRVKLAPTPELTVLGVVFNGDPSGGGAGEPLRHNQDGTQFPVHNAPLLMGEIAYAYNQAAGASGLPGTVKAGFWYHDGRFDDLRYGADGLSLADPASSGIARRRRGNHGVYAVVDQMLWRVPETSDQGISAFLRLSTTPGDRNPVVFYADSGFTYKGVLPGRPDDTLGIAFAYAKISKRARALDRDARAFGAATPIRCSEALLEITYQAQIVPGWTIQPDLQYVWRPGGNIVNPRDLTGRVIKNALVVGARTTIRY